MHGLGSDLCRRLSIRRESRQLVSARIHRQHCGLHTCNVGSQVRGVRCNLNWFACQKMDFRESLRNQEVGPADSESPASFAVKAVGYDARLTNAFRLIPSERLSPACGIETIRVERRRL